MSSATVERFSRLLGLVAIAMFGGAAGCMPVNQQLQTSHFALSHPDFWKVKQTAAKDGEPTIIVIPQYGSAVIDEGAGAMASKGQNYDAVTADVEVRLFSFADPAPEVDPSQAVANLLSKDTELQLPSHYVIPDNPPECGVYPKKYTVYGKTEAPIDLVKRPGWRTIVVGGRANGYLLGAVARVEAEPDQQRNCHNLSNMRVQLQNLLDGLVASGGAPAPAAAPPTGGETPKQ
jgi:hypothetical protein